MTVAEQSPRSLGDTEPRTMSADMTMHMRSVAAALDGEQFDVCTISEVREYTDLANDMDPYIMTAMAKDVFDLGLLPVQQVRSLNNRAAKGFTKETMGRFLAFCHVMEVEIQGNPQIAEERRANGGLIETRMVHQNVDILDIASRTNEALGYKALQTESKEVSSTPPVLVFEAKTSQTAEAKTTDPIEEAKKRLENLRRVGAFRASDMKAFWPAIRTFSSHHRYESWDFAGTVGEMGVEPNYFLTKALEKTMYVGSRYLDAEDDIPEAKPGSAEKFERSLLVGELVQQDAAISLHKGLQVVIAGEKEGRDLLDIVEELDPTDKFALDNRLRNDQSDAPRRGRPPKRLQEERGNSTQN